MSHAGAYIKQGKALFSMLEEGKPHTSVTDWIEVLSSDRYDELSLDGIPELVESVNIQGGRGTQEASRAIRKKLKYGNVHRQLRALVILRALTENAGKGFQLNWADEMLMDRLKTMANDSLLDPKVKKRLLLVFHAWSIQYADESRMRSVAQMYSQYSGAPSRRGSTAPGTARPSVPSPYTSTTSSTTSRAGPPKSSFDDGLFTHSWEPSSRGADTYADLAQARADAESRRAARDRQIALEQREAELERREREQRRKQDMAALEQRRQKDAAEEAERRRKMKEDMKRPKPKATPQKKFDLARERPNVMVSVANALQAANVLVNSMRHINREYENVQESPKVQENLDKAKVARRQVIRYIQVVQEEELVGTLLEANEKIVEAIQMYDRMSKPAALDSDSDHDAPSAPKNASGGNDATQPTEREMDALTRRMQAQRLEAMRTGELQKMQDRQKKESARERQRREEGRPTKYETHGTGKYEQQQQQYSRDSRDSRDGRQGQGRVNPDLADLDFGAPIGNQGGRGLQRPLSPDSDRGRSGDGGLSDFSDDNFDYDSSDSEYQKRHSRNPSRNPSRRGSMAAGPSGSSSSSAGAYAHAQQQQHQQGPRSPQASSRKPYEQYQSLRDEASDPFADDFDTPVQEKKRMQWTEI